MSDRAPVQRETHDRHGRRKAVPPGTITWEEHVEAWEAYAMKYGRDQSAERLAARGGFGYVEITDLLGREPSTWRPLVEP